MKGIKHLMVIITLLTSMGCATLIDFLPKVVATVTDAVLIIDEIERFVDAFFSVKPDPVLQAKVDVAISVTRQALGVALRTTDGAEHLSKQEADAAFDQFRKAYAELLILLKPLGIVSAGRNDLLAALPGKLIVPEPLALRW